MPQPPFEFTTICCFCSKNSYGCHLSISSSASKWQFVQQNKKKLSSLSLFLSFIFLYSYGIFFFVFYFFFGMECVSACFSTLYHIIMCRNVFQMLSMCVVLRKKVNCVVEYNSRQMNKCRLSVCVISNSSSTNQNE